MNSAWPDGLVRPLTGATFEQADQRPEVRFYSQQDNAYGAHPDEAGFYGHLENASGLNSDGILDMPRQEAYLYGRPDSVHNAYRDSEQQPLTDVQMMEVNKVLLEQTPERTTETETSGTAYHTERTNRDDPSDREASAIE